MKNSIFLLSGFFFLAACNQTDKKTNIDSGGDLGQFLEGYHEEYLQLFPLSATVEGDSRYNDQLPADFTDSYRNKTKTFFQSYLDQLEDLTGIN